MPADKPTTRRGDKPKGGLTEEEHQRWLDAVESGEAVERLNTLVNQSAARRAIAAFMRYGRHEEDCPDRDNDPPWDSCNCGFVEELRKIYDTESQGVGS